MSTRHLVDPEVAPLLDLWPTATLTPELLPLARGRRMPLPPFDKAGVTLDRRTVPGPKDAPDISLHIYRPEGVSERLPAIFHIHGGGYVLGAAETMEGPHRELVKALGCILVSVDYRLAPETVFPGAIEDCYAGLRWLFEEADAIGVDKARIGVMGESAGGGLAAALALLARDRGEFSLIFQHLIYPMLDDRTCTRPDPNPHVGEFIWHAANNHFGWTALLGQEPGGEGVSSYAAAARAEDLSGLPPAFISTGSLDLFLEEDLDYARRLLRAGVPTEFHVFPGGFHGYEIMSEARVSKAARGASLEALRRFLHG
jgi:triacylglycerol lipase